MIERDAIMQRLRTALGRAPVTALLGPRQCGKTTMARLLTAREPATYLDLEAARDRLRLANPDLALTTLEGLVVIDEIQLMPELFAALRVAVDAPANRARYLVLGSASPQIVRGVSETLAGRAEFVEMAGFDLTELGADAWRPLWLRGGFPRSFLAGDDEASLVWRDDFIATFLERDIPQLGIRIPPATMRRFWTMLAHFHGQLWNGAELARAMGTAEKQVRSYLDILSGTFMVRQLQPWYENLAKRQVRSPKLYLRDSGLLHALLGLTTEAELLGHPKVGASWEGYALEQVLRALRLRDCYFWSSHQGAEVDLFWQQGGHRFGVEFKFADAPRPTRSMHVAAADLRLDHLWVVYPGEQRFALANGMTAWPLREVAGLAEAVAQVVGAGPG